MYEICSGVFIVGFYQVKASWVIKQIQINQMNEPIWTAYRSLGKKGTYDSEWLWIRTFFTQGFLKSWHFFYKQ